MKRRLAIVCVLAGCMGLGPRPDRTRYFTLAPLAPDATVGTSDVSLGLGPIVFPGYLERMYIVRRTGANELVVSPTDRWAEPLQEAFETTLAQNLVVLLGTPRVAPYPWSRTARPALAVDVEVLRFEATTNGDAELAAAWHIVRVADAAVIAGRTSRITERAGGGDTDAAVAALSRALGDLGREIATAIRTEHDARRDRPRA